MRSVLSNRLRKGTPLLQDARNTILVVDDEVELLDLIAYILRRPGYEILEARTSREALSICERVEVPIDLVLSDFNLPGMNGLDLAKELERLRPNLPIIFMSGNLEASDDLVDRGFVCLKKPFTFADMVYIVDETLAGSEAIRNRRRPAI